MRRLFLLVALFTSLVASAQQPGQVQQLPVDPQTRYGKLDNGLTYYIRHNEHPKNQAFFYIAQKVGSVLEEDNQRGLAHFLEHMCFNGTKNFPENNVVKWLETIGVKFGAQLNAYTAVDETVYNIDNVPTQRESTIDSVMLILHDWSHDLPLDPKEIDKERGVIHEEWRSRSSAILRIFERRLPKLMSDSRPGNRLPIGTMEVVDNFPPQALRDYYETWYRPDLQGIIIVGDLNVDRTEKRLKEIFADIPAPVNPKERVYFSVPDNAEPIVVADHDKEQTMPLIFVMNKHEDALPREMRNSIPFLVMQYINSMAENMLNQRLSDLSQDPEAPFVMAEVEDGDFLLSGVTKAFNTQIVPKEGRTAEAVQAAMAEVYRAAKHGFTATEYQRANSEFLSQVEALYNNRETANSDGYVQECVKHFLNNEAMPGIETEYQLYSAVIPNIPVDAINQYFAELAAPRDSNLVILSMTPEKEGFVQPTEEELLSAVHAAQQMELEAYVDNVKNVPLITELPTPGTITSEKPGKFGSTVLTLSNGVRVILKQTDFKANEILMRAYSPGGTNRYGLEDQYTLQLLPALIGASGLGEFSSTELPKALAGKQASANPSITGTREYISGTAVPKDLRTMFELTYLRFRPLTRDDKAVSALLEQQRLTLRNQALNPMKALSDSIKTTLYGNNPYVITMDEADVDKVSYDRAEQIYNDRFADAGDFTFIITGAFDNDSIRNYACQYLATLPTVKRNDKPVVGHVDFIKGSHINRFQKKQEQPSTTMILANVAPIKYSLKNDMVATILGEVVGTRLIETVREEMGAAYSTGTQASLQPQKDENKFEIVLQTYAPVKPEMTDTCLLVIRHELENIAQNGIDEAKYLAKTKEYMAKTYQEGQRENDSWLNYLETFYRRGWDENTKYLETLQSITGKDVQKMAQLLLKSKNDFAVIMEPIAEEK